MGKYNNFRLVTVWTRVCVTTEEVSCTSKVQAQKKPNLRQVMNGDEYHLSPEAVVAEVSICPSTDSLIISLWLGGWRTLRMLGMKTENLMLESNERERLSEEDR